MRRADTLRRLETEPVRQQWWAGYMRGLRRTHHGENFGTDTEHQLWLSATESDDPMRAALGRGYRAGIAFDVAEPE